MTTTDEAMVSVLIERHSLELQVGYSQNGWQVRVRGYDPTGAIHEMPYTMSGVESLTHAMLMAAQVFCTSYGLPCSMS